MRILIFSDVPPSPKFSGTVVLEQMVRLLPKGSTVCFAVVNPHLDVAAPADMTWMAIQYVDKPDERGMALSHPFAHFQPMRGAVRGLADRLIAGRRILKKAEAFGRGHRVDAVFAILQGQTIINLARPLAERLGVPLYTLVWDPPVWWIDAHKVDRRTAAVAYRSFAKAIRASAGVAAASWAMAEDYSRRYGARCLPVIRSHELQVAQQPAPLLPDDGELVIAIAGQIYALEETQSLVRALNACGWMIRGRSVKLRFFGQGFPTMPIPQGKLEVMGWLSERPLIEALARCSLLYCPYPFETPMEEVSRLSFPSKLVTYLAAGRPTVMHGPAWSSPSQYVLTREAGVCATGRHASSIYNAIDHLVRDPDLYRRSALNAQAAFRSDFTLERMKASLYALFGLPSDAEAYAEEAVPTFEPIDERNRVDSLKVAAPSWIWKAKRTLAGRERAARSLIELTSPIRSAINISGELELVRNPLDRPARRTGVAFSTGAKPWDFVASLRLRSRPPGAAYLSVRVTSPEPVYALLVDRTYTQIGERVRIDNTEGRAWFDLSGRDDLHALIIQASDTPSAAVVHLRRAVFITPLIGSFRRKAPPAP